MLIHTPAPSSADAAIVSRGHTSACQCQRSSPARRRVDDAVPGEVVAQNGAQPPGRVGDRRPELRPARLGRVGVGSDPELVGEPAPGRRDRPQAVGVPDGARVLDPERRTEGAVAGEGGRLRRDDGRDLGKRDDLGVRVVERRPGGGALVHRHHRPGGLAAVRLAARAPGRGCRRRDHVRPGGRRTSRRARARGSRPPGPGSPGTCSGRRARSTPASPRARRRGGPAPAPPGGVIASCPSQNGHDDASAIRVVRPCAPGRRERPGAMTTGTPVSGFVRTSIRSRPFRLQVPRRDRSGWAGSWWSCWCPRSRAGSGGSEAEARSGSR